MKRTKLIALLCFSLFFITSCKKDLLTSNVTVTGKGTAKNGPVPSYRFNWETTTYLPSGSGGNQVPMPWNSGTTAIDPNIVNDYKHGDGWELAYNSFNPTIILNDPNYTYFFALYNKYRGILRFYLWQPASAIATSYATHGLSLYTIGVNSSMLNYNVADVVDTKNKPSFTMVQQQQINSAGGTWFVFQYEIAYDRNIANTLFADLGLTWSSQWANVSKITINGTQTGEIKGTVGNPASPFDFNQFVYGGMMSLYGAAASGAYLDAVKGPGTTTSPFKTSVDNAVAGIIKGFLSGIMGGSSGSTLQQVNLTMKSDIKLDGQIVNNGGMENLKLVLPGQRDSLTASGVISSYPDMMGVFNLSNPPTINFTEDDVTVERIDDQFGEVYYVTVKDQSFKLVSGSYQMVWNPAVINSSPTGASIQNLKTQLIQMMPYDTYNGGVHTVGGYSQISSADQVAGTSFPCIYVGNATLERVGVDMIACGKYNTTESLYTAYDPAYNGGGVTAVRISFDVVPNNGAPKTTIVKSFYGNMVRN